MRKFKKGRTRDTGKTCRGLQPRQRLIYEYWDGTRQVKADPDQIHDNLLAYPDGDIQQDLHLAEITPETMADNPKMQKDAREAIKRLVAATRKAFNVKPFADLNGRTEGLLDSECITLLGDFGKWVFEIKKKLGILPTSPKPMDSPGGSLHTKNGVACGGIKSEFGVSEASLSQPESKLPLEQSCHADSSKP